MEVEFPPLLTRFKPCSGIPMIRLESKTGTPSLSETRSFFSMPSEPNVVVIIPARWASVRFPGKPLAEIREKPMILWVVEKARQAERTSEVIVATDDQRIFEAVNSFGGKVVMTSAEHVSGSDRIAEVASGLNCDIVVNVQGDEPLMPPENIDRVVQALVDHPDVPVSTLMVPITSREEIADPNVVKVVVDKKGRALYFSRSAIPFRRDAPSSEAQMTGGGFPRPGWCVQTSWFVCLSTVLPFGIHVHESHSLGVGREVGATANFGKWIFPPGGSVRTGFNRG